MQKSSDGKCPACDRSYFGRREFTFSLHDDRFLCYLSHNSRVELGEIHQREISSQYCRQRGTLIHKMVHSLQGRGSSAFILISRIMMMSEIVAQGQMFAYIAGP